MVLDGQKKGRMTQLFGQKNYLETAPSVMSHLNCRFLCEDRFAKKRGFWLAPCGFAATHPPSGLRLVSRHATLAYLDFTQKMELFRSM